MSYCGCINCGNMVPYFEKYCQECVSKYNLSTVQVLTWKGNRSDKEERERIFREDLAAVGNLKTDKFIEKINVYTCPDGHRTVTVDRANGTTSMTIRCPQKAAGDKKGQCRLTAMSAWYRCDQTLEPTFEWYAPGPNVKLNRDEKEHVKLGGLLIREIGLTDYKELDDFAPTQSRNQPCLCGSGKKYKRCCLLTPGAIVKDLKELKTSHT